MEKEIFVSINVKQGDFEDATSSGFKVRLDNSFDKDAELQWTLEISDKRYVKELLTKLQDILENSAMYDKVGGVYYSLRNKCLVEEQEDNPRKLELSKILNCMGSFSWGFSDKFFIVTHLGNFIWSNPEYSGDNTIKPFNGTVLEWCDIQGIPYTRDKGEHLVVDYCGEDLVLVDE